MGPAKNFDETAREYLRRVAWTPRALGIPPLEKCEGLIEVYGGTHTGKSQLLVQAVTTWVLPEGCGGSCRRAVYFDNDFRVKRRRLSMVLEARIRAAVTDEHEVRDLLRESLGRVTLTRCSTTLEFVAALEVVDAPSLCAIDSIGAFVWREDKVADLGPPPLTLTAVRAVGRLLVDGAVVVAAKPELFPPKSFDRHEEYMPREWARLVRRRICLTRRGNIFEGRLFDIADTQSLGTLRSAFTFEVADEGCREWQRLP